MEQEGRKAHWEKIYTTRSFEEVSWYQPRPALSLELINDSGLPKSAAILDVGGGDSHLVDVLLEEGYSNLTVLDISSTAIEKAKRRLGEKSAGVNWIVSDITAFEPRESYDLWHDRAALHFLTSKDELDRYVRLLQSSVRANGKLVIGTFSVDGPTKCSGIEIRQYSEESMSELFDPSFRLERTLRQNHITPSGSKQNFLFGTFVKA